MKQSMHNIRARRIAAAVAVGMALMVVLLAGCSSPDNTAPASSSSANSSAQSHAASLDGQHLDIYCGAGMTDPFAEIADLFESETGCEMSVTYANAAQIQTQINTTGAGDFFIAGSKEELKPVETAIASSEDLVKHIPVLAVPASNPQNITGLASLANAKRVLVGDPESTPIGKIAMNALTNAGLWESLMASGVITTTTTAPQIATALGNGEGDVGIVWKENVSDDNVVIVDTKDLDSMVKVIPAAQLESAQDIDAANAFKEFLQTDAVWDIWASYGYERA